MTSRFASNLALSVLGATVATLSLVFSLGVVGWLSLCASRSFGGDTLRWLSFSGAAAIFGLAVVGLVGHEVLLERELGRLEGGARTHARAPVQLRPPPAEPARADARQTA